MVATVQQRYLEVQAGVTGQRTDFLAFLEAFFHRRPEFTRHGAAGNLRFEHKATAGLTGFDGVIDLGELAGAAGLFLVRVAVFDALGNGFAVGDLRLADGHFHAVGALEDVDLDIQVQFAHTLEDGLAAVLVGLDTERWIFLDHFADGDTQFFGSTLVDRRHGNRDHRVGEHHGFQGGRVLFVAQGMAGLHVLHAQHRDDVTGLGAFQFLARVGVHLDNAPDALGLAGKGVEHGGAFCDLA